MSIDKAWVMDLKARMDVAEAQFKTVALGDLAWQPLYAIKTEIQKYELTVNYVINVGDVRREVRAMRKGIEVALGKLQFVYIEPRNAAYFEQDKLYGETVHEKFEDARDDLKDAGNCLAASLPTACMFHLMRVTEHGLRSLAKKLHVQLIHKGKSCPIDFGDWDKVITGIKNKIEDARKLSAGPTKQGKLEMYSSAADHCEYMKDIWRNNLGVYSRGGTDCICAGRRLYDVSGKKPIGDRR